MAFLHQPLNRSFIFRKPSLNSIFPSSYCSTLSFLLTATCLELFIYPLSPFSPFPPTPHDTSFWHLPPSLKDLQGIHFTNPKKIYKTFLTLPPISISTYFRFEYQTKTSHIHLMNEFLNSLKPLCKCMRKCKCIS